MWPKEQKHSIEKYSVYWNEQIKIDKKGGEIKENKHIFNKIKGNNGYWWSSWIDR